MATENNGNLGDNTITVTSGDYLVDGNAGDDTLVINYGWVSANAYVGGDWVTQAYVGTSFSVGNPKVDYQEIEHLDVSTGSGDDYLRGFAQAWDIFDGGAGIDSWRDDLRNLASGVSLDMAAISGAAGQTLTDGSEVRNVEHVDHLTLTDHNDIFRDYGNYDDHINGADGNDDIGVSGGRDYVDGDAGDDTLTIDWASATDNVYVGGDWVTQAYVGADYTVSTRKVDYQEVEHLDVSTGSGDDYLRGFAQAWDKFDGGAGVDSWRDDLRNLASGVSLDMAAISGGTGQTLADGSEVRNVEHVDHLTLTDHNDIFRDYGNYDDHINGADGNDDIGVSGGRDYVDGDAGDDTLTIDWASATDNVYVGGDWVTQAYVGADYTVSTRKVDYQEVEHLDVSTGSGDDYLRGYIQAWDIFDGGAGVDRWRDDLRNLTAGVDIDMSVISTMGGQTLADGSEIRNVEHADYLTLTDHDDTFRDDGDYDDSIYGGNGNDDIGVSGGSDFVDGDGGDDTLTIDWASAADNIYVGGDWVTQAYVGAGYTVSTRKVDYQEVEHLDVSTGSGDDYLRGFSQAWDKFDGGAGVDRWQDDLRNLTAGVSLDMAVISDATGQMLADGSEVLNVEHVDHLILTDHNDIFRDYGDYDDYINGADGDDSFYVTGGRDFVDGDGGNDTLTIDWSGISGDIYVGGDWVTQAYVGASFATATTRVDYQEVENIIAVAGAGNDYLRGSVNDDSLSGAAGNDELLGDLGDDLLRGGEDDDTLYGQAGDDILSGNAGDDKLYGGDGNDRLFGGDDADEMEGGAGNDLLNGGLGDDDMSGDAGVDHLNGNSGNDQLDGGDGDDVLRGGNDNDLLFGRTGEDTLSGNDGDDRLYGSGGNDRLFGGNGADQLNGGSLDDTLDGGNGDDQLNGDNGDDTLDGGDGDDVLRGGDGDDLLFGRSGADVLSGNDGIDRLYGGGDNDRLYGGAGNDSLNGGSLNDRLDGGTGDDTLGGDDGDDLLLGRTGADTLDGDAGNDRLYGGAGDDRVNGGDGVDSMDGGSNDDRMDGGDGNDTMRGGTGNDLLLGRSGADVMSGGDGADRFYGGTGNDRLFGGNGDDNLKGGSDDDYLYGGLGDDSLTGNSGTDTFVFKEISGVDTVQDFEDGLDMIEYKGGDFADLNIVAAGAHVDITATGGGHFVLLNTDLADITVADFIFS